MRSTAHVRTESPGRYAKQLLSHLGRKAQAQTFPFDATEASEIIGGKLVFADGDGVLEVGPGELTLHADADTADGLAHVQDVLGRHLVRFGTRDELLVDWGDPVDH